MTTPGNLICAKCGFSNVPGDQFCGSCGTFLEWDGVPVEPTVPSDVPVIADPMPGPPPGTQPAPLPGPPPGVTAATTAPVAGLVRCPACGIANPADRTFCQSCGSKLTEVAARVTGATPEQIAAAVNAPATGPVVQGGARSTPDDEEGSGSRTKVLIALCVVGALLGVGVIAGYSLLRSGPETGATPGPTGAPTAGTSGGSIAPPSGEASGGPSDGPTSEPTTSGEPAEAAPLTLGSVKASSSAPNFPVANVHDGNDKTAWKEGVQSAGQGESLTIRFDPATVTAIVVSNGFSKDQASYLVNSRVKAIDVSVNGGPAQRIVLKDTANRTRYGLDAPVEGATTLKITIVSVYPGENVGGAQARPSTALGEIVVMGVTS